MHMRLAAVVPAMVVMFIGCQGPQKAPVAGPSEPSAAQAIEQETTAKEARAYVEGVIAEANRRAAAVDQMTFIDIGQFKRAAFFAPAAAIEAAKSARTTPDGAVRKQWIDRFALAQQFSYRYSLQSIQPSWFAPAGAMEMAAEIVIHATRKAAVAGVAAPAPQAPEGMVPWAPRERVSLLHPPADYGKDPLPAIRPPGQAGLPATDALAKEAMSGFKDAPAEKLQSVLHCILRYDAAKKSWHLTWRQLPDDWPEPLRLTWFHGLRPTEPIVNPADIVDK